MDDVTHDFACMLLQFNPANAIKSPSSYEASNIQPFPEANTTVTCTRIGFERERRQVYKRGGKGAVGGGGDALAQVQPVLGGVGGFHERRDHPHAQDPRLLIRPLPPRNTFVSC